LEKEKLIYHGLVNINQGKEMDKIVSLLRFFVESERYSIVDKLANALSTEAVRQAFYEALRIANTMEKQAVKIKIKSKEGKEYSLTCWEYGRASENKSYPGIIGELIEIERGPDKLRELKGTLIYCIPAGHLPNEEDINNFLNEKDCLKLAKIAAILAYSRRSRREEE